MPSSATLREDPRFSSAFAEHPCAFWQSHRYFLPAAFHRCGLPLYPQAFVFPKPKRKSRFGFYPVAAGNALQALQAIVEPSARHTLAIRFEDQAEEDDSTDPNDPMQHLHRQAVRIRRGEPIGRLSALLPARPSASAPPS